MVKYLGIFLASIACIALGFELSGDVQKRIRQLRLVKSALLMFRGEVEYASSSLEEAFSEISSRLESPISDFFKGVSNHLSELDHKEFIEIWTKQLTNLKKKSCLEGEDIDILNQLGKQIGYLDVDMQIRVLDNSCQQIDERLHSLYEESKVSCKLYKSLGILSALCIIVICI
ncbi:Stage III sporulation protein AB [Lachnospiraceae bacterium TWA4]|nr:Stage III sporulation protein AB [Lachnospiraceae bacterium TWA4]